MGQKLQAVLHVPICIGVFFKLIFVNLTATVPGVYVAFNLETCRALAFLALERTNLAGH